MPRPFTVTGFQHKLRKRVDSGVQPEEHVEDLREQKRAASGEGVLVERERQPGSPRRTARSGAQGANERLGTQPVHAGDLALRKSVARRRVQAEQFTQDIVGIRPAQRKLMEAEMGNELPQFTAEHGRIVLLRRRAAEADSRRGHVRIPRQFALTPALGGTMAVRAQYPRGSHPRPSRLRAERRFLEMQKHVRPYAVQRWFPAQEPHQGRRRIPFS